MILGRAGAVILRDAPGRAARAPRRPAASAGSRRRWSSRASAASDAERLRRDGDRAREAYVRHFYGCDARDPALYHLVIDSTALPAETVVEVIAAAVRR